jgi:hypothetical protein
MRMIATTSEQMLELVLFRLHCGGWAAVDLGRLVDVYIEFLNRTRHCVYGSSAPHHRDDIRHGLERDIKSLETKGHAQRTVSRVRLTSKGVQQAFWLKPEQALYGSLLPAAEKIFPPLAVYP